MITASEWNAAIQHLPAPHILQTWEWAQCKQPFGWQTLPHQWEHEAAAMVLQRAATRLRFKILYVPRGPLLDWRNAALRSRVLADLQALAHRQGAIFIKIDPEVILGTGIPGEQGSEEYDLAREVIAELRQKGWQPSDEQIQFPPGRSDLLRDHHKPPYPGSPQAREGVETRTGEQSARDSRD